MRVYEDYVKGRGDDEGPKEGADEAKAESKA